MKTYTFSDFDELQESEFISLNKIHISNQGLKDTYEYIHLGSGNNRYVLSIISNDVICKFSFVDNHIIQWKSKYCCEENICNQFKFKAYGVFDNDINCWIQNTTYNDNKLFNVLGVSFKLINIELQINEKSIFPISGIKSDYSYCELVMIPRQEIIRNINNHKIPYESLMKSNIRNINIDQQYVFINGYVGCRTTCFIRFYKYDILENIEGISYIIKGYANISNDEFIDKDAIMKISYYDNISIDDNELEFTVTHNIFGNMKRNEIGCMYKIID